MTERTPEQRLESLKYRSQNRAAGVSCPTCWRPLAKSNEGEDCATCKATRWPSQDAYVAEVYAVLGLEGGYHLAEVRVG
jgi:hypothetical protein